MEATKRPWEFIEHTKHTKMPVRMQGYSFGVKGRGTDGGAIFTYNPANIDLIVRAVNSHEILMKTGHTLAILTLQSIRYTHNPDFRDAVDDLLATIKQAEKEV